MLVSRPSVQGGAPCFEGTRIPIVIVWEFLAAGFSNEHIAREYPSLSREQVDRAAAMVDWRAHGRAE